MSEGASLQKVLLLSGAIVGFSLFITFSIISNLPTSLNIAFTQIEKPLTDKRSYSVIELPNKMKVMLVSDKSAQISAVSIDVGVGSFNEPSNFPGLAHFLEHMLFMGSSKYPNTNEFNDFINKNGGMFNAYTSSENTNYHYSISSEGLEQSLDIFSRFFIDPLLDGKTVEKEIRAVDSEYNNDITNSDWRFQFLLSALANEGHPFSRFSIGNINTLMEIPKNLNLDTYEALKKFHKQYYSANIMTAVIISNESTKTLEEMVIEKFKDIPNKEVNQSFLQTYNIPAFSKENLGKFVAYKSPNEQPTLSFAFFIKDELNEFTKKPIEFIAKFILSKGKNSLFRHLEQKGLVIDLNVAIDLKNSDFDSLVITFSLSEKGMEKENMNEIIKTMMWYLRKIESEGITKEQFEEFKQMNLMSFVFKEKSDDLIEEVRSMSRNLNMYSYENVLNADYIVDDFDPKAYKNVISLLKLENAVIIVGSKQFQYNDIANSSDSNDFLSTRNLSKKVDIYKLIYDSNPIPDILLSQTKMKDNFNPSITLPQKNEYVLYNITISNSERKKLFSLPMNQIFPKNIKSKKKKAVNVTAVFDLKPKLITDFPIKIWHKEDNSFKLPKNSIFVLIRSPINIESAENAAMTKILKFIFEKKVQEQFYDAFKVGYSFEMNSICNGLELKLNGYRDKNDQIIIEMLNMFQNIEIKPDEFTQARSTVEKEISNEKALAISKTGRNLLKKILLSKFYTNDQLLKVFPGIEFSNFTQFYLKFLSTMKLEMLLYGDFPTSSLSTFEQAFSELEMKLANNTLGSYEERILDMAGKYLVLKERNENPEDPNHLLLNYYQIGAHDVKKELIFSILTDKLNNEAFNYLRSELQLGYYVGAQKFPIFGINGLAIVVQGGRSDPNIMDLSSEDLLSRFHSQISNMTNEEFESIISSNKAFLKEGEKKLDERANLVWGEITNGFLDFNSKIEKLKMLKTLEKKELLDNFEELFIRNPNKLSIQIFNQKSGDNVNVTINEKFTKTKGEKKIVYNLEEFETMERFQYQFQGIAKNEKVAKEIK